MAGVTATGEPAYMTMYEFEHADVSTTDEWLRQRAIDPRNEQWQNTMEHAAGRRGFTRIA